jgi:hypothetical protein
VAANLFPPNFNLGDAFNGVLLCPICRIVYDRTIDPGFVFFPTDLQYFINYELEDARERAAEGSRRAHRVPTASEYQQHQEEQGLISRNRVGKLYRRMFLDFMGRLDLTKVSTAKTSHGEPMYAIRRAIALLGTVQVNLLPSVIHQQILQLHRLYFIDDPQGSRDCLLEIVIDLAYKPLGLPVDKLSDSGLVEQDSPGGDSWCSCHSKRPRTHDIEDGLVGDHGAAKKCKGDAEGHCREQSAIPSPLSRAR